MAEGSRARTCSLGSCDDYIFSQLCTNKIVNLQCPRYETVQEREKDTIGKLKPFSKTVLENSIEACRGFDCSKCPIRRFACIIDEEKLAEEMGGGKQ